MIFDPIADILTRIRNGQMSRKNVVMAPYSKMKHSVVKVLLEKNFIQDLKVVESGKFKELEITLKPNSAMTLRRVSKPGQRMYVKASEIKPVRNGHGISIISTSQGVISGKDAYKQGLGGEYVCLVY
ncbi:MAG: 30S ribosomal protein S8 [Patescibacteria group bacterium]|nr:30S ribosomal protein S8 [Patescibacteria group bacterium]